MSEERRDRLVQDLTELGEQEAAARAALGAVEGEVFKAKRRLPELFDLAARLPVELPGWRNTLVEIAVTDAFVRFNREIVAAAQSRIDMLKQQALAKAESLADVEASSKT